MSLNVCLADLLATKKISQALHDRMKPLYDDLVAQFEPRYGRAAAESMATERALDGIELDHLHRKRQALLQAKAQQTILDQARGVYAKGRYADGPISGKALLAHLVRDENGNGINNVEMHSRTLIDDARRMNLDLLARYRRNLLGQVRHKADELDLARALHGEKIDDLNITELADGVRATAEMQRSRFNSAGGNIPKLEDHGVSHSWDAYRVGSLTPDQFIDLFAPELDRARMIDWATGLPMSDARLAVLLRETYDSIVSEGANKATPGQAGAPAMANRFGEHRVLHFRDAEAWLRMNDRFGSGTVFDAINGQLERMARATATMEVLGPNPAATVRWMEDLVDIEAKTKGDTTARAKATIRQYEIEKVWAEVSGENQRAVRPNLALFMASARNWQAATKLGSAAVTALSDHATRRVTRSFAGMPEFQLAGQYARQIAPLIGAGDRDFVRRHMIISDEYAGRMGGLGRLHMDDSYGGRLRPSRWDMRGAMESSYEVSRRLADAQMRASGLSGHTIAAREVAAMEFVSNLSHWSAKGWDALNDNFRALLERNGIGGDKWDMIRAAPMTEYRGMEWLLPENIEDRSLRELVRRMQFQHVDLAVPSADLLMVALTKANPAGTVSGEITRTGVQFKMFPLTVMAQHGRRMMAQRTRGGRAGYAAAFLGSTTLMGLVSLQSYELINGRDPLPVDRPATIARAMQKGGGLGVFGDALMMSQNEYGQSVGDLTIGPAYSSAQNVASLGWAGAQSGVAALTDDPEDDAKAGRARGSAMRNLLKRETPVLNNWYTKLAYERLFVDQVGEWAAGQSLEKSYAASERYAQQRGTSYYAPPGSGPAEWRAPDYDNAMGQPREGDALEEEAQ